MAIEDLLRVPGVTKPPKNHPNVEVTVRRPQVGADLIDRKLKSESAPRLKTVGHGM